MEGLFVVIKFIYISSDLFEGTQSFEHGQICQANQRPVPPPHIIVIIVIIITTLLAEQVN